jgi:hypothetical protein
MKKHPFSKYFYIPVASVLVFLFFFPVLFSDRTFFFRDIHGWFYPMKHFLSKSFRGGDLPFWSSGVFCGSPFVSDIQSGVFYPISLIFLILPFPLSLNVYVTVHFFLGFCFFYLFIHGIGLSKKAAILTGISYCYGGYNIASASALNHMSTLIWLPAFLWSSQKIRNGKTPSGIILTFFFICFAILGGEPQLLIVMMALLFCYTILSSLTEAGSTRYAFRHVGLLLGLIGLSILTSSIQLGPTYLDYRLSARLGGIDFVDATRFSLSWSMLKHLLLPLPFPSDFATDPGTMTHFFPGNDQIPWLLTVYPGFLIVPLAILGIARNRSKQFWIWPVAFFISLALSLGRNTPCYRLFYLAFPFFRFPVKFMFLADFSLLVMAAFGFDALIRRLKASERRAAILFFFAAAVLSTDLWINHRHLNPSCDTALYRYTHPNLEPLFQDPDSFRIYSDKDAKFPRDLPVSILNQNMFWQTLLVPNIGTLFDFHHVGGMSGLELRYQYLLTEILEKPWSEKIHFLRLAGAKYILSTRGLHRHPDVGDEVRKVNDLVYEVRDPLPRAWVVGRLRRIKKGTIEELMDGSFDPYTEALSTGPLVKEYNKPYHKDVTNISYIANNIHIKVKTTEPGVLVLTETSYPGWRVFVDGLERPCLWLNLFFQGVRLEEGEHEVDFVFTPRYFNYFLFVSLGSFVCFLLLWIFSIPSAKKTRP